MKREGINILEFPSNLGLKKKSNELAIGIEITILDPDLDQDGNYTKPLIHTLGPLIRSIK